MSQMLWFDWVAVGLLVVGWFWVAFLLWKYR